MRDRARSVCFTLELFARGRAGLLSCWRFAKVASYVMIPMLLAFGQGVSAQDAQEYDHPTGLILDTEDDLKDAPQTATFKACLPVDLAHLMPPPLEQRRRTPVKIGLVASRAWPGGNVTGISTLSATLAAQRLALLRELVPPAARGPVLVNPADATRTQFTVIQLQ